MNKQLTFLFLWISGFLFAQIPAVYYDNAQGLTGYQLKSALKSIITNGHVAHTYNELYTAYETTDTDNYYENDGSVLDMYSENPNGPDPYNFQHNQDKCGNYSSEGDCYNREHLMPQSIFGSASPMKSDAHFVVPSDGKVNGMRSNHPFGEVTNPTWTSLNGSKLGPNSTTGYSGTVFEPIDEFKGDIARMLFYVATRYEDQIAGWGQSDMLDGSSDKVFTDWFLHILLNWASQDPVSQREIDRNNAVYNYQGNRNPFIDHPEWVNAIWNATQDTTAPSVPANLSISTVTDTEITIVWDAATDASGIARYDIYVDGNLTGSSTSTTFIITNLSANTTYNICVKAVDNAGNVSACSNSISATTTQAVTYLINENFDNCPTMAFTAVNEASDKDWHCITQYGENNSPAIQINGYQENEPSKDWLITTAPVNMDLYTNEKLSAFFAYAYGTTPLVLVYSADYDGNGSPKNFTWTPVPNVSLPVPAGSSTPTEYVLANADISSINGSVYFAFKYYSNGSPTRWTVDSVKLSADTANGIEAYVNSHIKLYPNPVHKGTVLYLKVSDIDLQTIDIYDISGKKLDHLKVNGNLSINTAKYSRGLYFIHLKTNKGEITKKLLIQ